MSTFVAVFAMVLAYLALVAAYFALRTLAKLRRTTSVLNRGTGGERGRQSLLEMTEAQAVATAALGEHLEVVRTAVDQARGYVDQTREYVDQTRGYVDQKCAETAALTARTATETGGLRNVALVRYDAFEDISGRMSFSLALLDDAGDGVAISAIAASSDTRVYAKGVTGGKGERELSPEEQQAVAAAMQRPRGRLLRRKAS